MLAQTTATETTATETTATETTTSAVRAQTSIIPTGTITATTALSIATVTVPLPLAVPVEQPLVTLGTEPGHVQQQLNELYRTLLHEHGYVVKRIAYPDSYALLHALAAGEVDLAIARPVDALVVHYQLPLNALPTDNQRLSQLINRMADQEQLTWLTAALLDTSHAIFARTDNETTRANPGQALTNLPQLQQYFARSGNRVPLVVCGMESQSTQLVETIAALTESYDIPSTGLVPLFFNSASLTGVIAQSECDLFFGLAAEIPLAEPSLPLRRLADPDNFFPTNQPTLVVRQAVLTAHADLAERWDELVPLVDQATLARFDTIAPLPIDPVDAETTFDHGGAEVPIDGEVASTTMSSITVASYQFLLEEGLLEPPTITVGSRNEAAQQLLGTMIVQLVQDAGFPVVDRTGFIGTADLLGEVEDGNVDIVVALLGEMLTIHSGLAVDTLPSTLDESMALARRQQDGHPLVLLEPATFSLTQVLLVEKKLAALGITTLSRLATYMNRFDAPFTLCIDSDFFSRPVAGLADLEDVYAFHFDPQKIRFMDDDTLLSAVQERRCQVTVGTMTDGRAAAWDLVPLQDDQGVFPLNNPLPVLQQDLAERHPALTAQLNRLPLLLDSATMQQLTRRVELGADGLYLSGDEETPTTVAHDFLLTNQLLAAPPTTATNAVGTPAAEQAADSD
ncbi:MAG: glycine betaine ABC transporter substrate-binding protein [Caldilineaceae bacterium]